MNNAPIGIFDSGMGGLTVMRALVEKLPGESFVYLGDTARLPYGTKSPDTVTRYAVQAAHALTKRGIKLLVVACNTASGVAVPALQSSLKIPVVGVIGPGAEAAIKAAPAGPIAVLATEGTVKGGAYIRAIQNLANVSVAQKACPLFVPMSEEGLIDGPIAEAIAHRYLDPLLSMLPRPKCLVLGCTHFPVLKKVIARVAGSDIKLVDSAMTTANAVSDILAAKRIQADGLFPLRSFLATDAPDRFARVGEIFLGTPINPGDIELVDLQ